MPRVPARAPAPWAGYVGGPALSTPMAAAPHDRDRIPDVRDGLTRLERVILWVLHQAQAEFGERRVPTATLYGRVVEHLDVSIDEFQRTLARLTGRGGL